MLLEQGQQTAVTLTPPHFINSPATSLGYLEFDLGAGSKVLSLSPNKQPRGCWLPAALRPLWPTPTHPRSPFSLGSLINYRLGPRQGSCRPPLSLLAQSFLSGVMAQLLPEACLHRDPPPHPETTGKHCLVSSDICLVSQAPVPRDCGAKWLWMWGDYPDPFLGP